MTWVELAEWIASMTPEQAATNVRIVCDAYQGKQDRDMMFIDVSLIRDKAILYEGPQTSPHIIVGE